jgi:hypothetical protein
MNRAFLVGLNVSLSLLGGTVVLIGQRGLDPVSERHPAIEYATRPTSDPVADVNQRIIDGDLQLRFEPTNGYLKSVLEALHVPVESQMLVYSETSLQFEHITQATPRALYFNDSVAVGWVKGADSLEVSAQDPQQGVVFYLLNQTPAQKPHFSRSQRCLECHEAPTTLGVPGTLTMSMLPLSDDPNEYATGWAVDHKTPIEDRWGGWFVTGAAVPNRHLGNVPVYHVKKGGVRAATAPNLTSVTGAFDTTPYLAPYSDIAALMVFNHQTHMTNLITRLNWVQRVDEYDKKFGRTPVTKAAAVNKTDDDPVVTLAAELVDYMLFVDEVSLTSRIQGNSGFTDKFMAVGPRDGKGRSLRELDFEKRLLKYPCSYMIYSVGVEGLPARAKKTVYDRLWQVLSGAAQDKAYARLSPTDRQAIIEILRDTKKDLPASFR